MHKLLMFLAMLYAISTFGQYTPVRSIPTGPDEHIMITGSLYTNPVITRIIGGSVMWSEQLYWSCNAYLSVALAIGAWSIEIKEGRKTIQIFIDLNDNIIGEYTTYDMVGPWMIGIGEIFCHDAVFETFSVEF